MNVGTFLTQIASLYPSKVAVDDGNIRLTYSELNERSSAIADGLALGGYVRGDRVVIFMPNNSEYFSVLFGLLKLGLVAVPVNAKLHPSELDYILDHSSARAVVYSASTESVVDLALNSGTTVDRINIDTSGPGSLISVVELGEAVEFIDKDVDPTDPAWLFYTSGTTGRPKGATLSHRNLISCTVNALADMCDFQSDDVVLHVAPLSHGSGLYALASIARGSRNLVYPHGPFDPSGVLRTIEQEGVTVIAFLAPTMIHMLLEAGEQSDTCSLRRVMYGGAPIDVVLAERAIERFGNIFSQLYGQGESPMTITGLRPQDHVGKQLSSAGIVRTGVEVKLVNEDGTLTSSGGDGEVCVRGDVVMTGYWNDPEANAKSLKDGWLHTGDVGRFEDGFLYLLSRQHDVIISGGSNIYPREVEDVLLLHPSVVEVCVFGVPDSKWGERVVAAVVASSSVDPKDLIDFCKDHIASFKKPSRIEFVDNLPKNAYGKVMRREIRTQLVETSASFKRG